MPYSVLRHDSRNPFQWAAVVGIWIYSLYQIAGKAWPGQIEENTEEFFRWVWGGTLTVGATLATIGMIYSLVLGHQKRGNRTPKGLGFEASGLYLFGLALLVYSGALFFTGKVSAQMTAVTFLCFGSGAIIRGLWIHVGLRRIGRGEKATGESPVLPRE